MPIFNQPKLASGQAGLALLLKTFEVDFLVIGGWAVRAHGYNRQTHDLDILLGQSQENAMRFANALSWAGQPMAP